MSIKLLQASSALRGIAGIAALSALALSLAAARRPLRRSPDRRPRPMPARR